MDLPAVLDSLDAAPAELKLVADKLWQPKDGKFVLSVAGFVPKERLDEFRNNNTAYLKERDEARTELEKYKTLGRPPEEIAEALRRLQSVEDKHKIDAGKIDEVVNARMERFRLEKESQVDALSKANKKYEDDNSKLNQKLSALLIDGNIRDAGLECGVKKKDIRLLLLLARDTWTIRDGELVAVRPDGTQIFSAKDPKQPLQPAEWISGLRNEHPSIFEQPSGGGAPGGAAGGGGVAGIDLSKLDPTERLKVLRRGQAA